MVLKKSKSRLNSGATQRAITHERMYNLNKYCMNLENQLQLKAQLNFRNNQAKESLNACLEKVHNYLGLDMYNTVSTYERQLRHHSTPVHLQEFSLNKKRMWMLPERIKSMMADIDFLKTVSPNFGLRLKEIRDSIANNCFRKLKTKITSASEVIAKSAETTKSQENVKSQENTESPENIENKQNKKTSRTRHTYHGRGVQRPHLFSVKQKKAHTGQHTQEEHNEEQIGHLDLCLYAPFQIEARSVSYDNVQKKFAKKNNTSGLKSSTKMKGRSKGTKDCRKGYCSLDFKHDEMIGLSEVYADNTDSLFCSDQEETNTTHISKLPETNYDVYDFIVQPKFRVKRKRTKRNNSAMTEGERVQKYTPSSDVIRYSKGSFIVSKEELPAGDVLGSDEINMSFSQLCNSDADNIQQTQARSFQQDEEYTTSENASTEMHSVTKAVSEDELKEFDSCFVHVNLVISEDQEDLFSPSDEQKNAERLIDSDCTMSTGESFLPCFVVDFYPSKMRRNNHNWRVLIGRKSGLGESSWLVSLQDKWEIPAQTKRHLQRFILAHHNSSVRFSDLIKMIKDLDTVGNPDEPTSVNKTINERWLSSYSVWSSIQHKLSHTANISKATYICTAEEASQKLQEQASSYKKPNTFTKNPKTFIKAEALDDTQFTECGICLMMYDFSDLSTSPMALLPCSHIFCVSCWRKYLHHSVRNGASSITCMETNCVNKMDMITAASIIPYELLNKWQSQVRDRHIDSSPYCSWCPNVDCRKVAVSRNGPMKQQFGKLVICNCKRCWCSGCQEDPHWPASCDQIAAYKKLLAKTDSNFIFPGSDTIFQVEVKKCPSCQYPIEKNNGCHAMICFMCGHAFCWHCLKNSHTHGVCDVQNIQPTTYLLPNKLEVNLPLKSFPDCLMLNRKINNMNYIKPWLERLRVQATCLRQPSKFECAIDASTASKTSALHAEECMFFLKQAYTLQETMHLVTGFAELNNCKESRLFAARVLSKMNRLDFITGRLEETVVGKPLLRISKFGETVRCLLQAGHIVLTELSLMAAALQHLTKDIDTSWIGGLDPNNYVRYK